MDKERERNECRYPLTASHSEAVDVNHQRLEMMQRTRPVHCAVLYFSGTEPGTTLIVFIVFSCRLCKRQRGSLFSG